MVNETLCNNEDIFITEKTFKNVLISQPFICFSSKNHNKSLTNFGFVLYDEIIDYSFDSENELEKRIDGIIKNLNTLKNENYHTIKSPIVNNKLLLNYYNLLIKELYNNKVLNDIDLKNIKLKLDSKLFTLEEIILQLENLKSQITINTNITNDLPQDFFKPIGDKVPNDWENDYTILNTSKWQVPMPRPPVCINNSPCRVCPTDSSNYINLQQWDDARYVLQKPQN